MERTTTVGSPCGGEPTEALRRDPRPMIDYNALALPKGPTRQRMKGRKARAEQKRKKAVRAACEERDSLCRLGEWEDNPYDWHADEITDNDEGCDGPSEWAHMHVKRRSKTRGLSPEERHSTVYTLMLCRRHHAQYDGRDTPRLLIQCLTDAGADGPMKFWRAE